jgi:hypothetical protein
LVRKPHRPKPYTVFIASGDTKPVKHLAINLGAPADMKDDDGTVWFGYPGPKNDGSDGHIHFPNYGVKFNFKEKILPGMGYYYSDYRGASVAGTDKPWLFTSGCVGLCKLTIPLIDHADDSETTNYTVRLGFMPLKDDPQNGRVFDIKLQGKTVESGFKITNKRDSRAIIREFTNVAVNSDLKIELAAYIDGQGKEQVPLLNFIEIIRYPLFTKEF